MFRVRWGFSLNHAIYCKHETSAILTWYCVALNSSRVKRHNYEEGRRITARQSSDNVPSSGGEPTIYLTGTSPSVWLHPNWAFQHV